MSEGTKLGEFKESVEFNAAVKQENSSEETLRATKIGEMSEFERSLLGDSAEKPKAHVQNVAPTESDDDALFQEAMMGDTSRSQKSADSSKESKSTPENEFQKELARLDVDIQEGDVVTGIVRSVEKSGIFVDIGFKSDGFIPNDEFSNDPRLNAQDTVKVGDIISAHITKLESKEGYTMLSRKRAEFEAAWNKISDLARTKDAVQVMISSKVQGGLVAEYLGLRGFIPASQVTNNESELDEFIGKELTVSVLRSDRKRRKIIFSHKLAKNRVSRADVMKILDELEIGQIREGRVASLKDFGVFVDLGGIEGLIHISELSWSRVNHPSDLLSVGDTVRVFVLGVDKETRRISLGMKQLEADPWVTVTEKYHVGDVVTGTITRLVTFGAFVRLENALEGLVHISELSNEHVRAVEDILKPGQVVTAKIIKIITDEQKIGLSIKAVNADSNYAKESSSEASVSDEATV